MGLDECTDLYFGVDMTDNVVGVFGGVEMIGVARRIRRLRCDFERPRCLDGDRETSDNMSFVVTTCSSIGCAFSTIWPASHVILHRHVQQRKFDKVPPMDTLFDKKVIQSDNTL